MSLSFVSEMFSLAKGCSLTLIFRDKIQNFQNFNFRLSISKFRFQNFGFKISISKFQFRLLIFRITIWKFRFWSEFLPIKMMGIQLFQNLNFFDFFGIMSEINPCWLASESDHWIFWNSMKVLLILQMQFPKWNKSNSHASWNHSKKMQVLLQLVKAIWLLILLSN